MKKASSMAIKVVVALVGIAATIGIIFFTPAWGTGIFVSFICAACCWELCVPTGAVGKALAVPGAVFAAAVPWALFFDLDIYWLPVAALIPLCAAFAYYAVKKETGRSGRISYFLSACLVFPAFFALLIPVLTAQDGRRYILIPFIAAWSADTGAQIIGRLLGKRKLAPEISPNKTVAGFVGGLVFGVIGMGVYTLVIRLLGHDAPIAALLVFGLVASLAATAGDLYFSHVKREYGIKDFGSLMPEHGGVMDRFDSVAFVLPLFYAFYKIFI